MTDENTSQHTGRGLDSKEYAMKSGSKWYKEIMKMLLVAIFCSSVSSFGTVSVKIFSRDEALSESNISKPRIYIQNTGSETINNFYYRYYFTTENGKTPIPEDYFTPNENITISSWGSGYYIQYTVTGANLTPGGVLPGVGGNCVGIHYADWSSVDKTNDFSNKLNSGFMENQNIAFFYNGARIYGNEPGGTGSILREVWSSISGTSTDSIPLTTAPSYTGYQTGFDAPRNVDNNFGVRLRGFITASQTGAYTFWIASDDGSKLFLSTDANPANVGSAIAWVNGYTAYKGWNCFPTQKSSVRNLVAGEKYYIEVLYKDGTLDDHCTVGWLKPGESGTTPSEVISGAVLTPYTPAVFPTAPSALVASAQSAQRIDLSWTDNATNETGFKIQRAVGDGEFSQIAVVGQNTTLYQVVGLTANTTYRFRVLAFHEPSGGVSAFSSIASATTPAPPAGVITREIWLGITGENISQIPLTTPPQIVENIDKLETEDNWGDYYGERIRGYLTAPSTGAYTFWIASDNQSELWLSTNADPANEVKIAFVNAWTGSKVWNSLSTQKSLPINLVEGQKYSLRILHKEGISNDNLAVAWLKPGQSGSGPSEGVPGAVLSPSIITIAPPAPTALSVVPISASQIDVSWVDNGNNETGFKVERAIGGGTFVEVENVPANVTVFHDGGLAPLTGYRYRVRAWNSVGNSSYSTEGTVTTLQQTEITQTPIELLSFGIYSDEETVLKDRSVFSGGGAIGSNGYVELNSDAVVNGNVLSGNTILLKSNSQVNGNVTGAGVITVEPEAVVSGSIEQGVPVAIVTIPTKSSITIGTQNIDVVNGENRVLLPGYYKNCTVQSGGTLTLSSGVYTFDRFILANTAIVTLATVEYNQKIDVDVKTQLEFGDNSQVNFATFGYAPYVRFYTNDANTVKIGEGARHTGMIIAPYGNVYLYSGAHCNGAIYAKTTVVEADAIIASNIVDPTGDPDNDGYPTLVEVLTNKNPLDSNDYENVAIPDPILLGDEDTIIVTYQVPKGNEEYEKSGQLKLPRESLRDPTIPPLVKVRNKPDLGAEPFIRDGYRPVGRYFIISNNELISGTAEISLPLPNNLVSGGYYAIALTNENGNWDVFEASSVDGVVTATISHFCSAIIVQKLTNATAYLDGAMIYSTDQRSCIGVNLSIHKSSAASLVAGVCTVRYKEYTDPDNPDIGVDRMKSFEALNHGSRELVCNGMLSSANRMEVQSVQLSIAEDGINLVVNESVYNVKPGVTLLIATDKDVEKLGGSYVGDRLAFCYQPMTFTLESVGMDGEGQIKKVPKELSNDATNPDWFYNYYLKDHLGSTRMVVSDAGDVLEAIDYQPYGTMSDIAGITTSNDDNIREKFTGKEFDEDGAAYSQLEIDFRVNFPLINTAPEGKCRVGVYFTAPNEAVYELEIAEFKLDEGTGFGTAKAVWAFPQDKVLKWLHFVLYDENGEMSTAFVNVEKEVLHEDGRLVVSRTFAAGDKSFFPVNNPNTVDESGHTIFTYDVPVNAVKLAGLRLNYFGARYYDPEVGLWTGVDPAKEFVNSYRYTTNPIAFIDMLGLTEIYIIANLGRAQTPETNAIRQNLNTLANRYREAGYDVFSALDHNSSQIFIDAINDNEAQNIYYVGHGGTQGGYSSIGFDDINNSRFFPFLVNNAEFPDQAISASNTNVQIDVASCNQNREQWTNSLPNTTLHGGNDLVRSSETFSQTPIQPRNN